MSKLMLRYLSTIYILASTLAAYVLPVYIYATYTDAVYAADVSTVWSTDTPTGIYDSTKARTGNFSYNDIPGIIVGTTEILLAVAGTVSVVAIIWGAVEMQFNSGIVGKTSDWGKKRIIWWIIGFAIAILGYFFITQVLGLLAGM